MDDISNSSDNAIRFWTRDSFILLSTFILVVFLVVYFWWPLAEALIVRVDWDGQWWTQLDWFLIGIFAFMTFTIVARANLKTDALLIFVGLCGGLVIEAWGTQTNLWSYYTAERPPLWIIPAWPIANLSIDRIARTLEFYLKKLLKEREMKIVFKTLYWIIVLIFMSLMIVFVSPTFDKSFTIVSLIICLVILFSPKNYRRTLLIFIAGTALGYFLELWGTNHRCWTYYTLQTPPLFAVMAHGMAAVAFWRMSILFQNSWKWMQRSFLEK